MSKTDRLDLSRVHQFAWRIAAPGAPIDLSDEPDIAAELAFEPAPSSERSERDDMLVPFADELGDPDDVEALLLLDQATLDEDAEDDDDDRDDDTFRREAREACALIADGVSRTWAIAEPAQQAQATSRLILRASEIGLPLAAIQHHPRESVRLLRLVVRHLDRLSPEALEAASHAAIWLDYSHAEAGELVLEVASAGSRRIEGALLMAMGLDRRKKLPQPADFGARLARLIDEGPSWDTRLIALHFAETVDRDDVVPALRRALRAPHLGARWWALHALNRRFPSALQPEDVLFLLEDAVLHPPPDDLREEEVCRAVGYYPEELARAVARIRPPGGDAPLVRLVTGDCVTVGFLRSALDWTWALVVLAECYPERARPIVESWLSHPETWRRSAATDAAAKLPVDDARGLLLRAAADGSPDVSERARKHWLDRFLEICPSALGAGLDPRLLEAAPSERLLARIRVLRGPPDAREAMASVLLAEAPDAEALAALAFALADDALVYQPNRAGLPGGVDVWCQELVARFGGRGVDALCALADRYPEGRAGWLWALHHVVGTGAAGDADHPKIQAVAARRVLAAGRIDEKAIAILDRLGAPASTHERLFTLAMDPAIGAPLRATAARALARSCVDPALDARVTAEQQAGLDARDLPRVARAAAIGIARRHPPALALAREALDRWAWSDVDDAAAIVEALEACASGLRDADALPSSWLVEALARPETTAFRIAARLAMYKASPEVIRALRAALGSPARDGAAAAEAAKTLLRLRVLGPRNPKLAAICAAAPLAPRGDLLADLLFREAPFAPLWPSLEEALTSGDPRVVERLRVQVSGLPWRRYRTRLLAVYPRLVDEEIRRTFELFLELPNQAARYWQDATVPVRAA